MCIHIPASSRKGGGRKTPGDRLVFKQCGEKETSSNYKERGGRRQKCHQTPYLPQKPSRDGLMCTPPESQRRARARRGDASTRLLAGGTRGPHLPPPTAQSCLPGFLRWVTKRGAHTESWPIQVQFSLK